MTLELCEECEVLEIPPLYAIRRGFCPHVVPEEEE